MRWRVVADKCPCCEGSGWVAIVKSQCRVLAEFLESRRLDQVDPEWRWDNPDR